MREKRVDKVRASRDGHEFHEAWTARESMKLLLPNDSHGDKLIGIAVEGLDPDDQTRASSDAIQIADLTLYYGENTVFDKASRVEIVQFKYSPTNENSPFRASDAKKTVEKFAKAYSKHRESFGAQEVRAKLYFRLITNRPIYPDLIKAIEGIGKGSELSGHAKRQAEQFKKAAFLEDEQLAEFTSKCEIVGFAGNLAGTKKDLSRILADWSTASDIVATARLGEIRNMVREKAGSAGEGRNVIKRVDVLAVLGIAEERDLLPCPADFPEVGELVEREQLPEVVDRIPKLSRPLLIHAAGGVGKTVFMQSLAEKLQDSHEVVFFDCFAGGAYRSPADQRHLPQRGLIHIANTLACRGLCDPVLSGSGDTGSLLRTFQRRLEQSVRMLSRVSPDRKLLLFLDAIDNATTYAQERGEDSFPSLLFEFLLHKPISGVKLIASSRSHRVPVDSTLYEDFELSAFTKEETEKYVRTRLPDVKDIEIWVAQARSKGNARILEYLVRNERGSLDPSRIDDTVETEELIQELISSTKFSQGYGESEIASFLAGLGVLPPPVPVDEYAKAQGISESAVESFASDLAPLLERTEHGLIFRDEPTETLVREKYGCSGEPLKRVAENLFEYQDRSVYAARALPDLLYKLGDGGKLFELAFDERFPSVMTSAAGKLDVRYARLKAAARHAADERNCDQLVRLLAEISTVALEDQHGVDCICDYPDLVIAAEDADSTRRLFETPTEWKGSRHARLAIANALSDDMDEACWRAEEAWDWIAHWYEQPKEFRYRQRPRMRGPARLDIAAIPFVWILLGRLEDAHKFMRNWKNWHAYEVWEYIFSLALQAGRIGVALEASACGTDREIGGLAAALSFAETDEKTRRKLVSKLAQACGGATDLEFNRETAFGERKHDLLKGLFKACGVAVSLGFCEEAMTFLHLAPDYRPGLRSFEESPYSAGLNDSELHPFLLHVALNAAALGKHIREKDLLPKDLLTLCEDIEDSSCGTRFRNKFTEKLRKDKSITYKERERSLQFIHYQLDHLLALVQTLSNLLRAPVGEADKPFIDLLDAWETAKAKDQEGLWNRFSCFFQTLGSEIAAFALWTREDLKHSSVRSYIRRLHKQDIVGVPIIIEIVNTLSKRPSLHSLAGEEAQKAKSLIEGENDVQKRAYFYADLARAILPASAEEAAAYFRAGLGQMKAIGSEDDRFANWLLLFASSLCGNELDEKDFHTLTNICELNIWDDPEKFFWIAFGEGMSRTAGCSGLAKLARWDDYSKAPLNCGLLPYVTALLEDGKIDSEDALALNRLANPVEFFNCNTGTLATAIEKGNYKNKELLVSEVIKQFEENCNGILMGGDVETLATIANRILGTESETSIYFDCTHRHFKQVYDIRNQHRSYTGKRLSEQPIVTESGEKIVSGTDPKDYQPFEDAAEEVEETNQTFSKTNLEPLLEIPREDVPYGKRAEYIRALSTLENLNLYQKLDKLQKCKENWRESSSTFYQSLN